MDPFALVSLLLQGLGFAAIVVSVVYLARQTRELSAQTKLVLTGIHDSTLAHTMAPVFEISKVLMQAPELRPYFYGKRPALPEDENYERTRAMAVFFLDIFDYFIMTKASCPVTPDVTSEGWRRWIADMFRSGPVLRECFKEYGKWYAPDLGLLFDAAIKNDPTGTNGTQPASKPV